MALKMSDDAYVLEDSAIIMQGKAQNLMRSEASREAFSVCSSIAPAYQAALVSMCVNSSGMPCIAGYSTGFIDVSAVVVIALTAAKSSSAMVRSASVMACG